MTTKTVRVDPGADCKRRVANIRTALPKDIKKIIIAKYPEYNTIANGKLIENVLAGKSADLRLTEIFEAIAKEKGGKNG
jgi:hypothetical protein